MTATTTAESQTRSFIKSVSEMLFHAVREGIFAKPSRLVQLLQERPHMRVQIADVNAVIDERSVVRWHEWGDPELLAWPHGGRGLVTGWQDGNGAYETFKTTIPAFMAFAKCHSINEWACDIQDIYGFSNSDSNLQQFDNLDALVQKNARDLITVISPESLAKNLAHPGICILNCEKTTDHFVRFAWDRRLFLNNTGGSHHLAAARFIARRIGQRVRLPGTLRTYAVSEEAVGRLQADYDMFAISNDPASREAFHDAMSSFKATYFVHRLPTPVDDAIAVLLPRDETRSAMVASVMRDARMFDIGAHLALVCARQAQ